MSLPLQEFFFSYNRSQDFVFFFGIVTPPPVISNGPSLNKPLFNTCHTVSVLLPFLVQRSTRSHALVTLVCHGRCCRWWFVGVRKQSVFLGSARLFWRFLLNVKWENIKKEKIAQHSRLANICIVAKKRQRQLYCSEKTTATFVSSQIDDRWIGKWATKPHQNPPWKASPMWPGFKSRRRLQR